MVFENSNCTLDAEDLRVARKIFHLQISVGSAIRGQMGGQVNCSEVGTDAFKSVAGQSGVAELRQVEERVWARRAWEVETELGEGAEAVEQRSGERAEVRVRLADLGEIMAAQVTEDRQEQLGWKFRSGRLGWHECRGLSYAKAQFRVDSKGSQS